MGYTKLSLSDGFNMIGSQFLNVGGTTKTINEFFDTTTGNNTLPGLDENGAFQTTLRVWTGTGYAYYGWLDEDDGTANEVPEWNS